MIAEQLHYGEANSITGKDLAEANGCDIRSITARIEAERREGQPICASRSGGYYLASNAEELQDYCGRLNHRSGELQKTRRLLLRTLRKIQEKAETEARTTE